MLYQRQASAGCTSETLKTLKTLKVCDGRLRTLTLSSQVVVLKSQTFVSLVVSVPPSPDACLCRANNICLVVSNCLPPEQVIIVFEDSKNI